MGILFFGLFFFVIGLVVGSFINVVVDRGYNNESIIKKRSYCDFCKKEIAWFDLLPILSYLVLSGRCRNCRKKLSFQYPLVETVTGLLFALIFVLKWQAVDPFTFLFYLFTISGLFVIFVTDFKYGLIYDSTVFVGIIVTLLYLIAFLPSSLPTALLAALISALIFFLIVFLTRGKGMGEGDVKLVFWLGLLTGWPNFIVMIFLSFTIGGVISLILLLVGRKKIGQTIPFAPFLVIGTFLTMFWGNQIINYYIQSLL